MRPGLKMLTPSSAQVDRRVLFGGDPFRVGRVPPTLTSKTDCTPGFMEDLRYYPVALSAEDIIANFGAQPLQLKSSLAAFKEAASMVPQIVEKLQRNTAEDRSAVLMDVLITLASETEVASQLVTPFSKGAKREESHLSSIIQVMRQSMTALQQHERLQSENPDAEKVGPAVLLEPSEKETHLCCTVCRQTTREVVLESPHPYPPSMDQFFSDSAEDQFVCIPGAEALKVASHPFERSFADGIARMLTDRKHDFLWTRSLIPRPASSLATTS
jgi:hypothetical protein